MRDEALNFDEKQFQQKLKCRDELFGEQLVDFFGESYASDPSNFRFEIGDKKLIRIVRDHIIKEQNEKGAKFMRRFRVKTKIMTLLFERKSNLINAQAKLNVKSTASTRQCSTKKTMNFVNDCQLACSKD